ncbi:MAG: hypothetical protein LBG91_01890, partial [Treponema sp.]|nr:hypothetical protein [Treponema sp.]
NIIIQNITFWDAHGSTEYDTKSAGNGESKASATALQIENDPGGSGVWVDHCQFTDGTCVDLSRNYNHDGGFDIKYGRFITCSWTEFTNHDKVMLVGSNETAYLTATERQITLHHNYFHGTTQRMPRTRGTQMHIYNNYYVNIGNSENGGSFMGPGVNAEFIVENNFFGYKTGNTNIDWQDSAAYRAKVFVSGNNVADNNTSWYFAGGKTNNGQLVSVKPWTPDYSYSLDPNAGLPTSIPAGSGPTLVFIK